MADSRESTASCNDTLRDPGRLAALEDSGLLDSPAEVAFDRLTRLASQTIGTPIALLSLVDHRRQFFKSAVGLPEPWASRRETPLTHSFCQHVVTTGTPLVVSDARTDPTFKDNPAVPELGVIAYLGIPVTTSANQILGTLCVIDHRPRRWRDAEIEILSDLTAAVITEIELRREVRMRTVFEKASQASLARLKRMLNSTAEAIYSIDTEGRCTYSNDPCARLLGFDTPQQLVGKRMHDLIHHTRADGSAYPIEQCRIYRAFKGGRKEHVDDEILWRADGTSFPAEYWSYPIVENGKSLGAVVTFVDITQRQAAERRLRESEIRFRETFDNAAVGMAHVSLEGRWQRANDRLCQMLGYTRKQLLRKTWGQMSNARYNQREAKLLASLIAGERRNYVVEKQYRRKDDTLMWASQTVSLMHGDDGQPLHLICVVQDISAQKDAERALRDAKRSADAANRAKSEFLANMSHEIRTPMSAILGFADVLFTRKQDTGDAECVAAIKRNGDHLMRIIDDILDLSKIEAGKLEVDITTVDLQGLLHDIRSLMSVRAEEKSVAFSLRCVTPIPSVINSDPTRLRQILINLVGNAIKFTDTGSVCVEIEYASDSPPPLLRVRIIDSGIGMTPGEVELVYQPFTQADTSVTRRHGGTGLGLPIAKNLIDTLGGTLHIESEPNRGTTVIVTLPAATPDNAPLIEVQPACVLPSPGKSMLDRARLSGRVLVVEDQRDTRMLFTHYLTAAGAEVSVAVNGEAALEEVKNQPFDAVVMDMQMPILDGYRATQMLRERGFERPIIALTAAAMRGDRARCLRAGCDDYLSKPVAAPALIDMLARYLAATPAPETSPPEEENPAVARILVVDDSADACQALVELLKLLGYAARSADTGARAIELVQEFKPHAVVLDIGLPDMDGYEVAQRLKRIPGLETLPLIALSGYDRNHDPKRRAVSGFASYLTKPIDLDALKQALEALGLKA